MNGLFGKGKYGMVYCWYPPVECRIFLCVMTKESYLFNAVTKVCNARRWAFISTNQK